MASVSRASILFVSVFLLLAFVHEATRNAPPPCPSQHVPIASAFRAGGPGTAVAAAQTDGRTDVPLRDSPREARALLRDATLAALNLVAAATGNQMGHTGDAREQTLKLWALIDEHMPIAGTVCEIGFNVGHSAAIAVTASSATSFLAFDCGGKPSVSDGFALLSRLFPAVSWEFVEGNSVVTVPTYARAHAGTTCDVIHIDGAHDGPFPAADFDNARRFARADGKTLVIFDDCNCATEWCVTPLAVFKSGLSDGLISELPGGASYLSVDGQKKGSCLGWISRRNEATPVVVPTAIKVHAEMRPVQIKCN